jgi:FkbM family methyltransferase
VAPKGVTADLLSGIAKMTDHHKRHVGPTQIDYPALAQRSVHLHRWSAIFHPRPATTDAEVISEVWGTNDYRVPPEGFSGTVVDIGANVGAFSVLAARAGAAKVLAFEPEPANLNRLVHHMDLNRVAHRIVAYREAVTGQGLPVVTVNTGGGARVEPASGPWDDTVQSLTLFALLDGFGPVEFLKCDIEGGEYEAFAACPVEALAGVDRIALEFHGPAMPHLTHLDDDGKHLERWGALVAKLADAGRVETFGHPMRGGLIWWRRYGA